MAADKASLGSPSISVLPASALCKIFELAGKQEGGSITLVCKDWRQAFYSTPQLWRSFELGGSDVWCLASADRRRCLDNRQRLLCRAAPHIRQLGISTQAWAEYGWSLEALLGKLHPDRVEALGAICWGTTAGAADAAADLLPRFPRLATLALAGRAAQLPASLPGALCQLSQLRCLRLCTDAVPESAMCSILLLTQLTSLHLKAASAIPRVDQLSRMSRLVELHLAELASISDRELEGGRESALQPATQGGTTLDFPVPSELPALQSYRYRRAARWGSLNFAGTELSSCYYGLPIDDDRAAVPARRTLCIEWAYPAARVAALPPLLQALVPASSPLHSLQLDCSPLGAAAVLGCPPLASLQALVLRGCKVWEGSGAAARELLVQATQLTSLTMEGDGLTVVPSWLAGLSRLRQLGIRHSRLGKLPYGPYLAGLAVLDLRDCGFSELPSAVAGCTALRCLGLGDNVLSDLPGGPYLAGLEVLDLSGNRIARLPPVLAAALSLRCLVLPGWRAPALTPDDVEGVLQRLPSLRQLVLPLRGIDRESLAALEHATLPHLTLIHPARGMVPGGLQTLLRPG